MKKILVIGSSFEDCRAWYNRVFPVVPKRIVDPYFAWDENTLANCPEERIDHVIFSSESDIDLYEEARRRYGFMLKAVALHPSSQYVPTPEQERKQLEGMTAVKFPEYQDVAYEPIEIDESEFVPCQFPEFHRNG